MALVGGISVLGLLRSTEKIDTLENVIIEDVKLNKNIKDWVINITGIIVNQGPGINLIKDSNVWIDFDHVKVLVERVNITYMQYESVFMKESHLSRFICIAKHPHVNHQININKMDIELIYEDGEGTRSYKTDIIISKYV